MPRRLHIFVVLVGLTTSLAGCGDDRGFIRGDYLTVEDCGSDDLRLFEPFRMSLDVFGFEGGDGEPLFVRGQPSGAFSTANDVFVILIEDEEALREQLEAEGAVTLPFGGEGAANPDEGAPVRGSLVLGGRCPDNNQPLEVRDGTIRFEALGSSPGDHVHIFMMDFRIVDTRRDEIVGEGFEGEMDFTIRGGWPYQPFTNQ